MSNSADNKATLGPIMESDVPEVAQFLHQHMNDKFSAEEWEQGLRASWYEDTPNHGFMLRTTTGIVGAICALYSEQEIEGQPAVICNPHTWCVLEPYRGQSVSLVLSVIRQDGMHFTMYSPNSEGEEIFAYLGFKPLERAMKMLVNVPMPWPTRDIKVTSSIADAIEKLAPSDRKCVTDHQGFKWLSFVFYEHNGRSGFLIYKRERFKRLPCANLLYISDKSLFSGCWRGIRTHLLVKHGIFTTKTEQRLLNSEPPFAFSTSLASAKFYLSQSLPPEAFDYTYSELVAMDL